MCKAFSTTMLQVSTHHRSAHEACRKNLNNGTTFLSAETPQTGRLLCMTDLTWHKVA
jgi:hypothetical protein